MTNITVNFLNQDITFKNKDELKKELLHAMKFVNKNSKEYAQLRMIQLKYNL